MKQEDVKRRLEAIGRLRLLTATNEEMSQLVSHSRELEGEQKSEKRVICDHRCQYADER